MPKRLKSNEGYWWYQRIIAEKKFHKGDFDEIWTSSDYGHFVDLLLEDALVRKMETEDPDVDIESYEEVRQIAMDMSAPDDAFTDL